MSAFQAQYTDGRTGQRRTVTVRIGLSSITAVAEDGTTVADWPFDSLRLVEEVYPDQPVRLKEGRRGTARLTFADHTILDALAKKAPQLARHDYRGHSALRRAAAWIVGLVVVVGGLFLGLPYAAEPIAAAIPVKWEEALGRSVKNQVMALLANNSRTCERPEGRQAIEKLVHRLAGTVKTPYRFRVTVVDHELVNAFAAPGGYVVVFRGLIDKATTAEGLAGVMAHEMGHVVERHATEGLVKAIGIGVIMGALVGDTSSVGTVAAEFAADLVNKSYTRDAEREADDIGIAMLNRANIRAKGFADFFEQIAKMQPESKGISSYLSTHPHSRDRAAKIRREATGTGPAMTEAEWQALKRICR